MSYLLGLAQCGQPADGDVPAQVARIVDRASGEGVELLAFPECLMLPHDLSAEELRQLAEPLDGPFVTGIAHLARSRGIWVVFTLYETNPRGGQPYNTAVVVDASGGIRGTYRKCHLYDAHGTLESTRTSAGSQLRCVVSAPFATIGLGICYDLRFPEFARADALAGCDLLLFPSAWYDGPEKARHWETLLRARAIENECFCAGVCRTGTSFVGRSLVADPLGRTLARGPEGCEEALVTCEIDGRLVAEARDAMPMFAHRRPELYRSAALAPQGCPRTPSA